MTAVLGTIVVLATVTAPVPAAAVVAGGDVVADV